MNYLLKFDVWITCATLTIVKITENKSVLEMTGTGWNNFFLMRYKVLIYIKMEGNMNLNYLGHFDKKTGP